MRVCTKVWLEDEEGKLLLGDGRLKILSAIDRAGSLSAAAREIGMSYRAAWGKIRATEKRLGASLVEGVAGGAGHGGATLTPVARKLLLQFEAFHEEAIQAVELLARKRIGDLLGTDWRTRPRKGQGD
ncbi:MAG TPA: LysR family transcriptional regulator [Polyangia bacterium]|nr:LysR family transcriptional regulator [Polyangia bacterium]